MTKSGKTSPKVAKKAAKELRTGKGSKKDVRSVAGSDLRQAGNRRGGKKK